ncbi:hypothetical protein [Streptomyces sp. NPDC017964]|uniref:hypothetical protein n=1 Tax=Streptomyces sp. NPDC017964 TaxID=3365022 RepID=UPI0037A51FE2
MPGPRLDPLVLSKDERRTLERWANRRRTALILIASTLNGVGAGILTALADANTAQALLTAIAAFGAAVPFLNSLTRACPTGGRRAAGAPTAAHHTGVRAHQRVRRDELCTMQRTPHQGTHRMSFTVPSVRTMSCTPIQWCASWCALPRTDGRHAALIEPRPRVPICSYRTRVTVTTA